MQCTCLGFQKYLQNKNIRLKSSGTDSKISNKNQYNIINNIVVRKLHVGALGYYLLIDALSIKIDIGTALHNLGSQVLV